MQVPDWLAAVVAQRPLRYFPQIGSTNDEAAGWAMQDAPAGALVLADEQVTGRGRYERRWQAAPGSSILLSLILRPQIAPDRLPLITLMGAVALAEVLSGLGLSPGIKWPNDVLLHGRKTAGILAEAVWHGNRLAAVVLGMGINVRRDALPEEDAAQFGATTIEAALGRDPGREVVLARLLERLDGWRGRLDAPDLLAAWREYSVTLGQQVIAHSGADILRGLAEDIDDRGALLLRLDDGTVRPLLAGDVTLHGNND